MTLLNLKKHKEHGHTALVLIGIIIMLSVLIVLSVSRTKAKLAKNQPADFSQEQAMKNVSVSYERTIRELQLEIQSSSRSSEELRDQVENLLLEVRVPIEKLDQHLSATIAVRRLTGERIDAAGLVAILETLL